MANNDWLLVSVAKGLQLLLPLHLSGAPARSTITATAQVWTQAVRKWPIRWDQGLDEVRIEQAFWRLASQIDRWPTPNQLKPLLPARTCPTPLPKPSYSPEKAKENLAKIKTLLQGVKIGNLGAEEKKPD